MRSDQGFSFGSVIIFLRGAGRHHALAHGAIISLSTLYRTVHPMAREGSLTVWRCRKGVPQQSLERARPPSQFIRELHRIERSAELLP